MIPSHMKWIAEMGLTPCSVLSDKGERAAMRKNAGAKGGEQSQSWRLGLMHEVSRGDLAVQFPKTHLQFVNEFVQALMGQFRHGSVAQPLLEGGDAR